MDLPVFSQKTTPFLRDPEFKRKLQELRRVDNITNWVYLARTYLMLALIIGATIGFYQCRSANGWAILWNVPVTLFAIATVGAPQHHLACLAHEAAHNSLFKSRYLNDLVGEWLCSFPMISSNFHYGLHHLAHHQFVNDPERDPDLSQLQQSGQHACLSLRPSLQFFRFSPGPRLSLTAPHVCHCPALSSERVA